MTFFADWLNANPAKAEALRVRVAVKKPHLSNVKSNRSAIPQRWLPHIVELSNGKLSYANLVNLNLERKERLKAEANSSTHRLPNTNKSQ